MEGVCHQRTSERSAIPRDVTKSDLCQKAGAGAGEEGVHNAYANIFTTCQNSILTSVRKGTSTADAGGSAYLLSVVPALVLGVTGEANLGVSTLQLAKKDGCFFLVDSM